MEYVPGESLRDRLARDGRFDDRSAVVLLRDLARALGYADAQGVVHRDVKPENVLLDRDSRRATLTDFGVAQALAAGTAADPAADAAASRLTGMGIVLGSPRYMSPEQAAGERRLDGRSDVYALGLLAYEMFAGEPAVTATSAATILVKHLTEKPTPIATRSARVTPALADSLFTVATTLDSTFALAHYRRALTLGWGSTGGDDQALAVRAAVRNATRLPARERALVEAYGDFATAMRAQVRGDTIEEGARFVAAQRRYAAIVARDSGNAEAWYGLGDALWHHRPHGWGSAEAVTNWSAALRAFNRTLALDSSFHLAYSHKMDMYRAASEAGSPVVLDGDSLRRLNGDLTRLMVDPAVVQVKRRAAELAVGEARHWADADPVPQACARHGVHRASRAARWRSTRCSSRGASARSGSSTRGRRCTRAASWRALASTSRSATARGRRRRTSASWRSGRTATPRSSRSAGRHARR